MAGHEIESEFGTCIDPGSLLMSWLTIGQERHRERERERQRERERDRERERGVGTKKKKKKTASHLYART